MTCAQVVCSFSPFLTSNCDNAGIIFEKTQLLRVVSAHWDILSTIELNGFFHEFQNISSLHETLNITCSKLKHAECFQLKDLYDNAFHEIVGNNELIQQYIPGYVASRAKRGLFNFVGRAQKVIFGTLSDADEERYNSVIENLQKNQNNLILLAKQRTSIINGSFNAISSMFSKYGRQIQSLTNNLNNWSNIVQNEFKVSAFYSQLVNMLSFLLMHYNLIQRELLSIITLAEHGILHPLVIDERILQNAYKDISNFLPMHERLPVDIHNVKDVLAISEVKVYFLGTKLKFILTVPLVEPIVYDVIKPLPVPTFVKLNIFKQLRVHDEYYVVNNMTRQFFPTSNQFINSCKKLPDGLTFICTKIGNHKLRILDCVMSLYFNSSYPSTCGVDLISLTSPLLIQLNAKNSWLYVIRPNETFQLGFHCLESNIFVQHSFQGTGILTLTSMCSIHLNGKSIYPNYYVTAPSSSCMAYITVELPKIPEGLGLHAVVRLPPTQLYFTNEESNPLRKYITQLEELEPQVVDRNVFFENQTNLIACICFLLMLGIIVVLFYFCRKPAIVHVNNCHDKPAVSESHELMSQRENNDDQL